MVRSVRVAALATLVLVAGLVSPGVAAGAPPIVPDVVRTAAVHDVVPDVVPDVVRVPAARFGDVPDSHPFAVEIAWLVARGIANGYPDGTYHPGEAISREAMAAFLYRAAGSPSFTPPATSPFSDVMTNHPFYREITWLRATGITTGWPDGTFRPGQAIARDAMAAFLYRSAGSPSYTPPLYATFPDVPTGHTFYRQVEWLGEQAVTQGYDDGGFRPTGSVNRDAMAAFVYRNQRGDARVVGTGTPGSCTSAALQAAVQRGGYITFDCGPDPVTIPVAATLHTCNTDTCAHPWQGGVPVSRMVLDGGGLVTLDGQLQRGIYYANTCQETFGWLSGRCDLEVRPAVTFKDITFVRGNASAAPAAGWEDLWGGGAIAMRGGRLTLVHVTVRDSICMTAHSDGGGGGLRVTGQRIPARAYRSTFTNNSCANGGSVSSLGAPLRLVQTDISNSVATGHGASAGLGGNGGAVYFDGTWQDVTLQGVTIHGNVAPEGGPGVFYVSNDRTGTLTVEGSTISGNSGESFFTPPYHDVFYLGTHGDHPVVLSSVVE